jgi:hypothetical protein
MTARQTIAFLCLVALVPSCTYWVEYSPGPPSVEESPVRVTTVAGQQVRLTDPFVEGSDYVGSQSRTVVRVPLDSIARFELRRFHVGRSVLLVIGPPIVFVAGVFAIASIKGFGFEGGTWSK